MPDITLLTETELRRCVTLDSMLIDVIDTAFASLCSESVIMPPVLSMDLPMVNGEVDVKTAYVPGLDTFAIKISPGFFDNPAKGLPSLNGLMVNFAADTGLVRSVLLDNGYLTDLRTAAAGGVAARHLAPHRVPVAGVIGTGVQAELQLRALLLEREVDDILVWGRDSHKAREFAERMQTMTAKPVQAVTDRAALVRESTVVITTTPSRQPLIDAAWLHPGLHITAMGSDAPDKNELDPQILREADRLVVDRITQSIERGEMRAAIESGAITADHPADELGLLCAGQAVGRSDKHQVTVCDLTGTGIQDTAIADHVQRLAIEQQLGQLIRN